MDSLHAVNSALRTACGTHGLEQPSTTEKQHTHCRSGAVAICELGNKLHTTLQVKDDSSESSGDSPSDEDGNSDLDDENISNSDLKTDGSCAMSGKCLHKCATFPVCTGSEGKESESQLENKDCTRSLSMPSARKIVSAMKGSREKEGVPQKKLSVSWAPDVYDPPPTSVSHYPRKKNQQQYKNHKKHGKGKQKGKNVRGGGSVPKDKKHQRKVGGRSSGRCLDSYTESDRVHNYKKPSLELLGFNDVGDEICGSNPDPNCGSSFMGQVSGGTMHCVC